MAHPRVSSSRFSRFLLRTTDVESAAGFYDAVLEGRGDGIVPLHESAIARGARPHWLGHVQVRNRGGAEAVAARFVERGATRLGPPPGVADFVVFRDAGGAIIAVTDHSGESSAGVVWHHLSTRDPLGAVANYGALFGWSYTEDFAPTRLGPYHRFAYGAGESAVGTISDIEGRPEVHPHRLFFFGVPSLDAAVARVRRHGGTVIGPIELPGGVRVAACDDPQGAAFGIIEPDGAARLASA